MNSHYQQRASGHSPSKMPRRRSGSPNGRRSMVVKQHPADMQNGQKLELLISDKTVEMIMGPEPIPSLDIEMDEIQNELQRKMVEEIQCVMCLQFPYMPLECMKCNKLFCKYCQLQLQQEAGIQVSDDQYVDNEFRVSEDRLAQMSPRERKSYAASMYHREKAKQRRQLQNVGTPTPGFDICCPNCQARGDFMQEVNKVLKNCIDFCEFPHKCYKDDKRHGSIIWKTMKELQEHAMYECPKFGCDICYQEQYQHMTRFDLFQHIKRECPEVMVQCQVCNKDIKRAEFANHECLKDAYGEKLKRNTYEITEYLADYLVKLRRGKELLGLCANPECVERFRMSTQHKAGQGMIAPNTVNQAVKCYRCKTIVAGYEESYNCVYCNEHYCPPCLGYTKYFDLEELDVILQS